MFFGTSFSPRGRNLARTPTFQVRCTLLSKDFQRTSATIKSSAGCHFLLSVFAGGLATVWQRQFIKEKRLLEYSLTVWQYDAKNTHAHPDVPHSHLQTRFPPPDGQVWRQSLATSRNTVGYVHYSQATEQMSNKQSLV